MYDLRKVGQICREARIAQGISQNRVAGELGYTQPNISKFEVGETNNILILLYYIDRFKLDVTKLTNCRIGGK